VFSRSDCYRRTTNLRVRPVPEMDVCLVFTPDRPHLYRLNAAAWLVFELCDGRSGAALEAEYDEAMQQDDGSAVEGLHGIVAEFEQRGIIERFAPA